MRQLVTIGLSNDKRQRFDLRCSLCSGACVHQGAALSLVLEEKLALGLSAPPPERTPIESLGRSGPHRAGSQRTPAALP